ncbi:hypothetical protein SCP_0213360 [Sparassis crispa]|uniref:Uncharacterized protein n=1 Tax=Sparassis crispa TaxID=139825 RepID=A0A401GDD4_9APHY|nr:hypothetical protein SCP_0213360 [Sparassis crispa]GBE80133.1 hypothetical protein SCP_0213360 [Sparassis crispa]
MGRGSSCMWNKLVRIHRERPALSYGIRVALFSGESELAIGGRADEVDEVDEPERQTGSPNSVRKTWTCGGRIARTSAGPAVQRLLIPSPIHVSVDVAGKSKLL